MEVTRAEITVEKDDLTLWLVDQGYLIEVPYTLEGVDLEYDEQTIKLIFCG